MEGKKNKKIPYVFLGQNFTEVQIWYGGMGSSLFYNRQGINGEDHNKMMKYPLFDVLKNSLRECLLRMSHIFYVSRSKVYFSKYGIVFSFFIK